MCDIIISGISKSIVSLLRQLAGTPKKDTDNINMPQGTPSQTAHKVFLLIIDLIYQLKKTSVQSDQYNITRNIIDLSLAALIDALNNRAEPLELTKMDTTSEKSYLEAIEILIKKDLYETKGNFIVAKGLIFKSV